MIQLGYYNTPFIAILPLVETFNAMGYYNTPFTVILPPLHSMQQQHQCGQDEKNPQKPPDQACNLEKMVYSMCVDRKREFSTHQPQAKES